jgi:hypothetical protein
MSSGSASGRTELLARAGSEERTHKVKLSRLFVVTPITILTLAATASVMGQINKMEIGERKKDE